MPRSLPLPNHHSPTPFTDYLIRASGDVWTRYVNHEFPNSLAAGTAKLEAFLHFIQQDYHFLKVRSSPVCPFTMPPASKTDGFCGIARAQQYARSNSLAAYKTEDMALMAGSNLIVNDVIKETEMHVKVRSARPRPREDLAVFLRPPFVDLPRLFRPLCLGKGQALTRLIPHSIARRTASAESSCRRSRRASPTLPTRATSSTSLHGATCSTRASWCVAVLVPLLRPHR